MEWVIAILALVAGVSLGIAIAWLRGRGGSAPVGLVGRKLDGPESAHSAREGEDPSLEARRSDIQATEDRLTQREAILEQRTANLSTREQQIEGREEELATQRAEANRLLEQARTELEQVADFDSQAAKESLLERVEDEARREAMVLVRELELKAREEADRRGRRILTTAIQRLAAEVTSDSTVSVVTLPSDDMKGRIIGRDGRNIKAFEAVMGVDLVVDDTPEAVTISTFDPIRREVARVALQNLIVDGRIHPSSIEEAHVKAEAEVEQSVRDAGEWALLDVGVSRMHLELVTVLGRLKYRTSYGQNVLGHSVEAAHIAGMLAAELGLDPLEAKRAALLHDVGKAVSHEVGGSHALVGAEIARRFEESPAIVHAIEAHHNEVEARTLLAVITQAADAVSASRPGARRETLESYVRRLERIEEMAGGFKGVDRVFAMQAGRDVRVVVDPGQISDLEAGDLARRIAKRIEDDLQYPGQIQVTVVRELRASAYAR
ncbi:MAG: ribonuclease Y [Acidimicrobiia bacterium]|nr:ribonuclease Y [Acidimicrobiia bacterium]